MKNQVIFKRSLSFKGNHKEIGEQVGKQYKIWGKKEVWVPHSTENYFLKQLKIYEKFFPKYIEYLEGLASGLDLPKDKVLLSYLTGFLNLTSINVKNECSVFALNNNDILIGRNYDWRQSSELISSLVTYEFTDRSANNFKGITDMGTWQIAQTMSSDKYLIVIEDAWNDKGLFICLNGAHGRSTNYGMSAPHIIQCIIEKCRTTEEAVELLKQIPSNNPKIFTIADKNGNFTVVEKSLEQAVQVRKSNKLIFTTNHYNHPDLILENLLIFSNIPFHSTFARYHYLEYNLLKNIRKLNLEKILSILNKPPATQNWRGFDNGDVVTIWTYALNLTKEKYIIELAPLLKEKQILKN